ncbi:Uncharacterised protein [Mobiluncus mulieris]|nr:Uncharacterised protein [Mobiluncus mulieris]
MLLLNLSLRLIELALHRHRRRIRRGSVASALITVYPESRAKTRITRLKPQKLWAS